MLKLLSLFSGIGAFEKALTRQNIEYQLVNYCEIDKYASKAYSLIHNVSEDLNLGDIEKVDENKLQNCDIVTWGFPCTDISTVGMQKGIKKGETKSGLYYEGIRILKKVKPRYSIIENVKALTDEKFNNEFNMIISDLSKCGYKNYWKVLNAKDFGIPQSRKRLFIISIREDVNQKFQFPDNKNINNNLNNYLSLNVEQKYYINKEWAKQFVNNIITYSNMTPVSFTRKSIKITDECNTLLTNTPLRSLGNFTPITGVIQESRLRTLTPLEYWLLMGFDLNDYHKVNNEFNRCFRKNIIDGKLYSLAGNSIVVNILEEIFKGLVK